jgi:hypothetical protein
VTAFPQQARHVMVDLVSTELGRSFSSSETKHHENFKEFPNTQYWTPKAQSSRNTPQSHGEVIQEMADISSFTGKFRIQKHGSYESQVSKATKRSRSVCNQCQKSKLRCDRGQPCGSCVKKGEGIACNYQMTTESRIDDSRKGVAEERLLHLESMVKELMQNQSPAQAGNKAISSTIVATPPEERPHAPGESINDIPSEQPESTRYVGSTHWSAILDDIHELKAVIGSAADDHEDEEEPLLSEAPLFDRELIFGTSKDYSVQQILSQDLPPKIEIDRLLSVYFRGETYIVTFVHTYHFQRQYREFWSDTTNVNPLWLSMLFSICHMACLIGEAGSIHTSQSAKAKGRSNFHTAAGKCLVLGQYHRPQQFTLEALAMYGHCKNLGTLDPSREAGPILGMVVRIAYEMGYHRDPDSFGSFTAFEGEMRRRFWAAIKQMDLMISFMLGLPSNIKAENCDTKSPRNLLDSDFDENTQVLPPPRSENEPTRLLWFIVKERQMISFGKVCQDALSFREKSETEIIQLDNEVREIHTTIPDVLRVQPISESIADAPFLIMTRIYLEFIHLKTLCVLHRKYMARGNDYSTKTCIEAGTRLVSLFLDAYKEFAPGGQLDTERWMLVNFTMNDFLLGVMVLCLVVHTRWRRGAQNSAINAETESLVLGLLEQSNPICVEKSTVSRDARRVSHAIRLTLNGAKVPKAQDIDGSQSSLPLDVTLSNSQSNFGPALDVDPESLMPPLWQGYIQGDEAAFGLLDPFNFSGADLENMNWTSFEPQI